MVSRLRMLARDDFFRHNVVFFVGSMLVAVLNYLYHPVMSRMMSVADFGEVQALFSLLTQACIPLSICGQIALNLYTNGHGPQSPSVRQSSLLTLYVALGSALAIVAATPVLITALKLAAFWGPVIVAAILLLNALTAFGRSYLQATHRFTQVSVALLIGAALKLACAIVLVWIGWAVLGALGGFFLATLATAIYVQAKAGAYTAWPRLERLRLTPALARELRYGVLVLIGTGVVTFFSTADITLAKFLFPAETAGLYSGISIIARIIFFATASVSAVLLSHIKISETPAANRRFLLKGLLLTTLIGGAGLVVLAGAPAGVIALLIGRKFVPYARLLPLLALHAFVLSLINVFFNYALALRHNRIVLAGLLGVAATLGPLAWMHDSPEALVFNFLGGGVVTVLVCFLTYLRVPDPVRTT